MPSTPEHAGTLKITASGKHFAEFSIGGGERKGTTLHTCQTREEAEARKVEIARLVARLRATGHDAMVPNMIEDAGGFDAEGMRKLARLVERIATGKEPGLAKRHTARRDGITVAELAKLWTTGDLAKQYPDHVKVKKTSDDDARILAWFGKVRTPDGSTFGDRPVASVTLDECDHVMGALPKSAQAPATRRQYAQALRKLLVYAVYPLRLLPAVPIPKGWLPKCGSDKAKAWLYPAEDFALMQYRDVPLVRRLLYGLLVREGMRLGEALALMWPDVDLERGVVRLDTNKTNDPRSWALGEDVTRALEAWRKLRGKKAEKVPHVFPPALVGHPADLARLLREGLSQAGVERPELTEPKPGRMLLRVHDLRGSFVTLALASGKTEAWVTDRTGHKSSAMIYLYKRASRTAAELSLGWFAPLDEAIPELAPKAPGGANGVRTRGFGGPARSRWGSRNAGKSARRVSSDLPGGHLGSAAARRKGSTPFPCTSRCLRALAAVAIWGLPTRLPTRSCRHTQEAHLLLEALCMHGSEVTTSGVLSALDNALRGTATEKDVPLRQQSQSVPSSRSDGPYVEAHGPLDADTQSFLLWRGLADSLNHTRSDFLLALTVIMCALIGSIVSALRAGTTEFRPQAVALGLASGFIAFVSLRGGRAVFMLEMAGETPAFNPYSMAFVGLLVGLFSTKAYALLSILVDDLHHRVSAAFEHEAHRHSEAAQGYVPALAANGTGLTQGNGATVVLVEGQPSPAAAPAQSASTKK